MTEITYDMSFTALCAGIRRVSCGVQPMNSKQCGDMDTTGITEMDLTA
ncbi:MAG: hypothetical protein KAT65_21810 [Methanophagales archaeon]|nr:hypothetical protein [Methanophagales archaeon]